MLNFIFSTLDQEFADIYFSRGKKDSRALESVVTGARSCQVRSWILSIPELESAVADVGIFLATAIEAKVVVLKLPDVVSQSPVLSEFLRQMGNMIRRQDIFSEPESDNFQIFRRHLASFFLHGYSAAFAVLKNDDVAFVT